MRTLLSLLMLGVLAAGCRPSTPTSVEDAPKAQKAATPFVPPEGFTSLTLGTTPYLDPELLERAYQPIAEHLSKALNVPVKVQVAQSYDDLGERMRRREVDLGSFSPLAFVRAQQVDPGLVPVVNFVSEGTSTSAGYLVVRADTSLRALEDLKGKRMAFVDPASATGYLFPKMLLKERGMDPRTFFSSMEFLGNHQAVLLSVLDGRNDVGAIYQGALSALSRQRGVDPLAFRVIAKTERTPRDLFCARSGLPPAVVDALRQSFLGLSVRTDEGRRVLKLLNVNGFIPADDALYERLRSLYAQSLAEDAP